MARHSIETWAAPGYDHVWSAKDRILDIFDQMRQANPKARLHILIETGDRYAQLRSRIAKRAAKKRRTK